jgi:hypothetical protein
MSANHAAATPAEIPEDLIDMRTAATLAHCDLSTLYRWIDARDGKPAILRAWKRSGRFFVSRAELLGLFEPVNRDALEPERKATSQKEWDAWVDGVLREHGIRKSGPPAS